MSRTKSVGAVDVRKIEEKVLKVEMKTPSLSRASVLKERLSLERTVTFRRERRSAGR
jgi:hypothetical protein